MRNMIINSASKVYGSYMAPATKNSARASRAEEKKDTLVISGQAKDFQKIMAALSQAPDVRQDKVDELKKKYDSGSYTVDSMDIAGKILEA